MRGLYERSNIDDDGFADGTYGVNWSGQIFTPSITHIITSVKLFLYRQDGELPGTITVSIRATSSNLPTGADLCSGTLNGNTLNLFTGVWYEIKLGAGTLLTAGTKYAIVIRAPSGDASNRFQARVTNPGTYAGGRAVYSSDSGVVWANEDVDFDFQFEDWGEGVASHVPVGAYKRQP